LRRLRVHACLVMFMCFDPLLQAYLDPIGQALRAWRTTFEVQAKLALASCPGCGKEDVLVALAVVSDILPEGEQGSQVRARMHFLIQRITVDLYSGWSTEKWKDEETPRTRYSGNNAMGSQWQHSV
jgi:hypothetical protein